jgi:hypothetical protein
MSRRANRSRNRKIHRAAGLDTAGVLTVIFADPGALEAPAAGLEGRAPKAQNSIL